MSTCTEGLFEVGHYKKAEVVDRGVEKTKKMVGSSSQW